MKKLELEASMPPEDVIRFLESVRKNYTGDPRDASLARELLQNAINYVKLAKQVINDSNVIDLSKN